MATENKKLNIKNKIYGIIVLFFIFFTGCVSQQKINKQSCPPITSNKQAAEYINDCFGGLKPFKASGNCVLNYRNEKKLPEVQSFQVRIWFVNADKFCVYGDIMLNPKGLCFVVSGEDFWAYAKPMNIYIADKKSRLQKDDSLFYSPAVILDFLEPLPAGCRIETENIADCGSKKIYFDSCEKVIKKIEYFDKLGKASLGAELSNYKKVIDGKFYFPHKLKYTYSEGGKYHDSMEIKLDSVRLWQPSNKQVEALFSKPDANSFNKDKVK